MHLPLLSRTTVTLKGIHLMNNVNLCQSKESITDRHEEAVLVAGLAVQLLAVLVEGGGGQPLLALAALQTGAVVRGAVGRYVGLRWER